MKTLNTIQTLSRIGKVISTIIFVCCIVGFFGCIVGIICMALGMEAVKLGGVTLKGMVESESGMTTGNIYAAMACGAVLCAGEALLAKFAERYFTRELAAGTPFTPEGAKELRRLGILAICIPIGTQIAAEIVRGIFAQVTAGVEPLDLSITGSVSIGVMLLVGSLLCKHAAELIRAGTASQPPQ